MVIFTRDDIQYRRWLATNPEGYVLNCCYRAANSDYPRLHRVTCKSLNSPRVAGYTAEDYYKACATEPGELEKYAAGKFGRIAVCPICEPYGRISLQ